MNIPAPLCWCGHLCSDHIFMLLGKQLSVYLWNCSGGYWQLNFPFFSSFSEVSEYVFPLYILLYCSVIPCSLIVALIYIQDMLKIHREIFACMKWNLQLRPHNGDPSWLKAVVTQHYLMDWIRGVWMELTWWATLFCSLIRHRLGRGEKAELVKGFNS